MQPPTILQSLAAYIRGIEGSIDMEPSHDDGTEVLRIYHEGKEGPYFEVTDDGQSVQVRETVGTSGEPWHGKFLGLEIQDYLDNLVDVNSKAFPELNLPYMKVNPACIKFSSNLNSLDTEGIFEEIGLFLLLKRNFLEILAEHLEGTHACCGGCCGAKEE